jgi:hypothetical protein
MDERPKIKLTEKQLELLKLDFADAWECDRTHNTESPLFVDLELLYDEIYSMYGGREVTVTDGLRFEADCHYDKLRYSDVDNRFAEMASYRGLLRKIERVSK